MLRLKSFAIAKPPLLTALLFVLLCSSAHSDDSPSNGLPGSADLRPLLEKYELPSCRQGNRGTCSVFTMTGALEFAVAKRQGHCPRLSVDFLNWAANKALGRTNDGGFFSDMWSGFSSYGICRAEDFPTHSQFDPVLLLHRKRWPTPRRGYPLACGCIGLRSGTSRPDLTAARISRHQTSPDLRMARGRRFPLAEGGKVGTRTPSNSAGRRPCATATACLLVGYRDEAAQTGRRRFHHPQLRPPLAQRIHAIPLRARLHERRRVGLISSRGPKPSPAPERGHPFPAIRSAR